MNRSDAASGQKTRNAPTSATRRPVRIDQRPRPVPLTAGVTLGKVTSPDSVARAAEDAILRVAQNVESRLQQLERRSQDDDLYFVSKREAAPHLSLDPRRQCWVFDDFVGPKSTTMDGLVGFTSQVSGTGAANTAIAGSASHPGVIESATGTTTTGHAALMGDAAAIGLGLGRASFHAGIRIPTLSTPTERFDYKVGLLDLLTGTETDGIYFANGTNWQCSTRNNSSLTQTDSGVAMVAGTWVSLEIRVDGSAERVEFLIDDDLVAVHTTNIAGAAGREMGLCAQLIRKTAGTTSRTAEIDYCGFRVDFLNPR